MECGWSRPRTMRRMLVIVGVLALCAWTGLGLFAWSSIAGYARAPQDDPRARDAAEILALKDELGALRADVRALATAMGTNLQALQDAVLTAQAEHADALARQIAALLEATRAARAVAPDSPASEPQASGEPAGGVATAEETASAARPSEAPPGDPPSASTPTGAKPRKSFLAFQLPSDDLRFDERRAWTVLPALSRVGFDGKSTLHDFTAATSSVEGELEADLSHPDATPRARIRVRVAGLDSGNSDRDAEMRAILQAEAHPVLEFELTRFEAGAVDVAAQRCAGTAHGRLGIRGVTQEVAMPVRLSIDDARRLLVEGE